MSSLLAVALTLLSSQAPVTPTCLSRYGKTVCGFDCVAMFGDVKCARTPGGVCTGAYGAITCWDPEPQPGRRYRGDEGRMAPWQSPPVRSSRCLSHSGVTACGYACVAQYGEVRCAQTPQGACRAEYGVITCWDPPSALPGDPAAECLSNGGTTACGYACVAQYGQVKCAQTPRGTCRAASGEITCWDPERRWPGR